MPPRPRFAIDYDALRVALVAAVRAATGLEQNHVIVAEPEQPGAPRPAAPFATLKIISGARAFGDDGAEQLSDTLWRFRGPRAMVVSFQFFGRSHEEALAYAAHWQAALGLPTIQARLAQGGLAVWNQGAVADISALMQTGYEGRASIDVTFGIASTLEVDLGTIETAPVTATVADE